MHTKKRYCIFAAQYFPHLGGVERYTYNLSKKLIEKGNEVVIVTSNVYRLSDYEIVDGIPVYRVPCINLLEGRYDKNILWSDSKSTVSYQVFNKNIILKD